MIYKIPKETLYKLIDASNGTVFRLKVERFVEKHFKNTLYLTSARICDCIVLDLLLNDEITPYSADEIISCVNLRARSFYTAVENCFYRIKDEFAETARTLIDDYDNVLSLDLRTANLIVYVLAKYLSIHEKFDKNEIMMKAFSYKELEKLKMPHY